MDKVEKVKWFAILGVLVSLLLGTFVLLALQVPPVQRAVASRVFGSYIKMWDEEHSRIHWESITGIFPFAYTPHWVRMYDKQGRLRMVMPSIEVRMDPLSFFFSSSLWVPSIHIPNCVLLYNSTQWTSMGVGGKGAVARSLLDAPWAGLGLAMTIETFRLDRVSVLPISVMRHFQIGTRFISWTHPQVPHGPFDVIVAGTYATEKFGAFWRMDVKVHALADDGLVLDKNGKVLDVKLNGTHETGITNGVADLVLPLNITGHVEGSFVWETLMGNSRRSGSSCVFNFQTPNGVLSGEADLRPDLWIDVQIPDLVRANGLMGPLHHPNLWPMHLRLFHDEHIVYCKPHECSTTLLGQQIVSRPQVSGVSIEHKFAELFVGNSTGARQQASWMKSLTSLWFPIGLTLSGNHTNGTGTVDGLGISHVHGVANVWLDEWEHRYGSIQQVLLELHPTHGSLSIGSVCVLERCVFDMLLTFNRTSWDFTAHNNTCALSGDTSLFGSGVCGDMQVRTLSALQVGKRHGCIDFEAVSNAKKGDHTFAHLFVSPFSPSLWGVVKNYSVDALINSFGVDVDGGHTMLPTGKIWGTEVSVPLLERIVSGTLFLPSGEFVGESEGTTAEGDVVIGPEILEASVYITTNVSVIGHTHFLLEHTLD